jgi:hypothetical protein
LYFNKTPKRVKMGFWDKIKSAAVSAKCMTGFHAGIFYKIPGKPDCYLEKTCPDCNKYLTEIQHKFSNWVYLDDNSCDATRKCHHCEIIENSIIHKWYTTKEQCQITKCCDRCGYKELGRMEHGPWYGGVCIGNGMQIFQCSGCGETEKRKIGPDGPS